MNLVCEQVEFAPATEHNFSYSYEPIVKELPMEFAVEATKLLGLKLENSVG